MFSIVSFPNEVEDGQPMISLIPSNWLSSDKSSCFWPPYPAATAIKKLHNPSINWSQAEVEIIEENLDNYQKGLRHLKRAEDNRILYTTDAETPISRLRRRKVNRVNSKKQHPLQKLTLLNQAQDKDSDTSSHSSSVLDNYQPLSENEDDQLLKRLDALRNATSPAIAPETSGNGSAVLDEGYFVSQTEITLMCERLRLLEQQQEAFEKSLLSVVSELKSDIKELLRRTKSSDLADQSRLFEELPIPLPIKTSQQLEQLERWIYDDNNRVKLVSYCSTIGGTDAGKIVRKILTSLFSTELARQINFIGVNGKIEFRKLKLKGVILEATRANSGKLFARQLPRMSSYRTKRRRIQNEVNELLDSINQQCKNLGNDKLNNCSVDSKCPLKTICKSLSVMLEGNTCNLNKLLIAFTKNENAKAIEIVRILVDHICK